jgi:hypothetical protein
MRRDLVKALHEAGARKRESMTYAFVLPISEVDA